MTCLLLQLEVHQGLCVPFIQFNRELHPEDGTGSITADASLPVLAQPSLDPVAAGDNSRYPEGPALSQRFTDLCERRVSSAAENQRSVLNRVEIIRSCFRSKRFPDQAIDLILAGNQPTTHAGYVAAWNQWSDWCNRNAVGHHPLHRSLLKR